MPLLTFLLLFTLSLSPLGHSAQAFKQKSFEAILNAEFAFEQGDYQRAQQTYYQQALQLDNAYLAKRASQAAFYNNDPKALLKAANLWQKLQKDQPQALAMLSLAQVYSGLFTQAFSTMAKRFEITQESEFYMLLKRLPKDHPSTSMVTKTLQQFTLKHPDNSDALLTLANLYQRQGNNQASYNNLQHLMNVKTTSKAQLKQALQLATLLPEKNATKLYQQAIKNNPKDAEPRYFYAKFLSDNWPEKAKAQLQLLLKTQPTHSNGRFFLGLLQLQTKHYPEATSTFKQLLKTHPQFNEAQYYLGAAYFEQKKYPEAEGAFKAALQQNPNSKTQTALIKTLWQSQQYQKAQKLINQAINESQEPSPWYYLRAMLQQETSPNNKNTEQDLQKALASNPEHIQALNALGYIWAEQNKNLKQALAYIEKAHQLEPDNAAILDSLGWVLYRLGRNDEAIGFLQQALKKWPSGEISAHLIEVLWQDGQQQAAKTLIDKTLEQQPKDPHLHETLQRLAIDHPTNS